MPSLGVPVRFSEISHMTAICELMMMHEFLTPDVSLGTHFFGELVEMNILYFALFPGREGNRLNLEALMQAPNRLAELAPEAADQAARAARGARGRPESRRRLAGGGRRRAAGERQPLPADAARLRRRVGAAGPFSTAWKLFFHGVEKPPPAPPRRGADMEKAGGASLPPGAEGSD